ncbi:MAG: lipid-A-disaccharide synthase [Planctomyces sp.]|nr:lipid-A-disaccharide synthase [Planctomyces sp.]
MHLFFSVGEPSGDQHAAHLIRALQHRVPGLKVSGLGGPAMEVAGCDVIYPLTNLAVMGIFRVLPLLSKFYSVFRQARAHLQKHKPDAVILIDFPGFNWHIAKAAKSLGIPVYYFMPPQMWAWGGWRIHKLKRTVDHVLSGLQFETEWYAKQNVAVTNVGHPFFDEVAHHPLDQAFIREWKPSHGRSIALLPGSRGHEVTHNWPRLLEAARLLNDRFDDLTFFVASYKEKQKQWCSEEFVKTGGGLRMNFFVGRTPEIIDLADCAMVVSGSVALELLARRTPYVTFYSCSKLTHWIGRQVIDVAHFSLPNLMASRRVFPELLFSGESPTAGVQLADALTPWLASPAVLNAKLDELDAIRREVVQTGAMSRTADVILKLLGNRANGNQDSSAAA